MDIFSLLSYINKVSLLAFFVTTLVVGYQLYILKKEKTKEQAPSIPDFKDKGKSNKVINYTLLPGFLIKKNSRSVSYSKLVFLIISLLTIMVVIFVLILIKQNSASHNQASVSPAIVVSPTPILKPTCTGQACLTPTKAPTARPTVALLPSLTPTPSPIKVPTSPSPAVSPSPSSTVTLIQTQLTPTILATPTLSPTDTLKSASSSEIVLAQAPSLTPIISADNISSAQKITNSKPQVLPETGNIGKGFLIFGVAISTIFFSFWF
ncbi:MAG TPA: hypothetical protein VF385_02410 [Patescibacteria group bacterium]